jgi:hypothetical protein
LPLVGNGAQSLDHEIGVNLRSLSPSILEFRNPTLNINIRQQAAPQPVSRLLAVSRPSSCGSTVQVNDIFLAKSLLFVC